LATVHRLLEQLRAGPASIGAFISGVVFGLLTAATGGFDFLDGWLIAAYVLVVIFLVMTTLFLRGALKLGRAAVEAEAGTRSIDDVARELAVSRALPAFLIDLGVVVAFIADMVLKPF
jgi:Na+/melibiose symporter-like transporter